MEGSLPAYYRTNDPVDNLLVRLTIKKKGSSRDPAGELALRTQATLSFAPARADDGSASGAVTSTGLFDARSGRGVDEEAALKTFEFAWQQKVYGPRCVLVHAAGVGGATRCTPQLPSGPTRSRISRLTSRRVRTTPPPRVCRELLKYAAAIADKRAGRRQEGVNLSSPIEVEHMADVERRLDAGEPLFEVPPGGILLYTMTDRDGYVPPSEASRPLLDGSAGGGGGLGGLVASLPAGMQGPFSEQWGRLLGRAQAGHSASALPSTLPGAMGALPGAAAGSTGAQMGAFTTTRGSVGGGGGVGAYSARDGGGGGGGGPGIVSSMAFPLSDARGVFAHAYKENPYSVMYVIAAVGIDRDAFRMRRGDTPFFDVPLMGEWPGAPPFATASAVLMTSPPPPLPPHPPLQRSVRTRRPRLAPSPPRAPPSLRCAQGSRTTCPTTGRASSRSLGRSAGRRL